MKTKTRHWAAAAASLFAGAGFAYANDDDQDVTDQTHQDQGDQNADQSISDQGYNPHWFSSTGYGPNDEQADQTRQLNREQIGTGGRVDPGEMRGQDDDQDIQGPSDDAAPDADDNDDDQADDN
jgi:hypothetical protein